MNKYESVIIIKSNLTESERKAVISELEDRIKKDGKITEVSDIGLKRLAYEINGNTQGYYVSHQFEIDKNIVKDGECIRNIEKFLRTQDEIIKFIIVDI